MAFSPAQQGTCVIIANAPSAGFDIYIPGVTAVVVLGQMNLTVPDGSETVTAGQSGLVQIGQGNGGSQSVAVSLTCPDFPVVTAYLLSNAISSFPVPANYVGECSYSATAPDGYYITGDPAVTVRSPLTIISPTANSQLSAGQTTAALVTVASGQTIALELTFDCETGGVFEFFLTADTSSSILIPATAQGVCQVDATVNGPLYAPSSISLLVLTPLTMAPVGSQLTGGQNVTVQVTAANNYTIPTLLTLTCATQAYSQQIDTGSPQIFTIPASLSGTSCLFTTTTSGYYLEIAPLAATVALSPAALAAILALFNPASLASGIPYFSSATPPSRSITVR